jgi:excisionase family DNA binding protein
MTIDHQDDAIRPDQLPRLLSVNEALFQLGVGRTLFYELIELGKLASVKIRRRRFVPREAIEQFIASLPSTGGTP